MSIFLDAHVHIYPIFSIDLLLGAALNNFNQQAHLLEDTESRDYVLCLTEGAGFDAFSQLQRMADLPQDHNQKRSSAAAATWLYLATSEPHCLIATNREEEYIY
ncbi:MAG: hypothetical protein KJO32_10050, partial [Deltaproteobacteria bacterium]|nr:hypothetical protein [Deltaproteobacteria bacterium]